MKFQLIVGLGNPEAKYAMTRHNIGFEALKAFVNKHALEFSRNTELTTEEIINYSDDGMLLSGTFDSKKVWALFPLEYMNSSGKTVAAIIKQHLFNLQPENILVIHDDKDLEFGNMRYIEATKESSSGGHNGIKSIINSLGTSRFNRLKIGVANAFMKERKIDTADFVLQKFSAEEQEKLPEIIRQAVEAID